MMNNDDSLEIIIPGGQIWDESKEEFLYTKPTTLVLKHSLVSISKWEAKWKKPFLSKDDKTKEEIVDYVRCMTITQNVDPEVYNRLPPSVVSKITDYISDPMTATWFSKEKNGPQSSREIVTSELIYYMMIAYNIPPEYQKWHLNRLMTLIRICSIKNAPPKKQSKGEILSRNAALNAARRQQMGTKG